MLAAAPALAEQAVEARLAENPWFKKPYEPGTSALEYDQRVPFLWVEVDRDLRLIAEISEKIGTLEQINT